MTERRAAARRKNHLYLLLTAILFIAGGAFLWLASLRIPDLTDLSDLKVSESTKIYDRTGQILLYDLSPTVSRTIVPFGDISQNIKNAVISIEDKNFYHEGGINIPGILRAFWVDLSSLSLSQGGSTITQQVVKNSILTVDKSPARKLKEWVLAEKLSKQFPKDQVLDLYLNGIPLGGKMYGVEEATENFFGVSAKSVDIAQGAYIAAMIQAPTHFSPYGTHIDDLEARKNLVLKLENEQGYITDDEYTKALAEKVTFKPRSDSSSIKAPHFVFYVIDYLEKKYGEDALQRGGLKVTTTLDWNIEQNAEQIASDYGQKNQRDFNASNNAIVVLDPKSGDILSMVGSRDYFDSTIEGNFNAATSPNRQPGSTFKPFVYATLFNKGFTPSSILFDVPTQFSVNCAANNFTSDNGCFSPQNFDELNRGPMTIRDALALSINIPAVKALYLAGIQNSIDTAKAMGISTLGDANQYGLTLVLGSGQVSLLEMTSAYGVFANDGVRVEERGVLKVEDSSGAVLEEDTPSGNQVVPVEAVREINDVLSDNNAKAPEYGVEGSPFYFGGREVASKTGTTNNSRDAWVIGYTPNVVVGTWSGNNDNTPMVKKVAGLIVAPMWNALMNKILPNLPDEQFVPPEPIDQTIKPVLRGDWQSEYSMGGIHDILYWVDKNNPLGPPPSNPASDPQYTNWEYGVQNWLGTHAVTAPVAAPTDSTLTPVINTPGVYYQYPGGPGTVVAPTPTPMAPF